jgi:uroporphyrinogen-III synthase
MKSNISIVSTKRLQPAIKAQLLSQHIAVTDYSFIKTTAGDYKVIKDVLLQKHCHYVFTSSKAVEVIAEALRYYKMQMPENAVVYSLEGKTQKTLLSFGIKPILTATSAKQLAQMIVRKGLSKSIHFFCTDIRRPELPEILKAENIAVNEAIIYTTDLTPHKIEVDYSGILFFSPSAVQSFFSENKLSKLAACICIGRTTADAVKKYNKKAIILVADKPLIHSMISKAVQYYKSINHFKTT